MKNKFHQNIVGNSAFIIIALSVAILGGCGDYSEPGVDSSTHAEAVKHYQAAKESCLAGRSAEALRLATQAAAEKRGYADALALRLQLLMTLNKESEVAVAVSSAIKEVPKDPRFSYFAGLYFKNRNQYDEAERFFKEAAYIDPSSFYYKLAAAQMMIKDKRFGEAEAYLKKAVRVHPNSPDLLNALGILSQAKGDPESAALFFSKAVALSPLARPLQENTARSCLAMGKYLKAVHYLESLLSAQRLESRREIMHLALTAYLEACLPDRARHTLLELTKTIEDADYEELKEMADAAVALGEMGILKSSADSMITMRPKGMSGYLALAIFHEKEGNQAAAWMALERYRLLAGGKVPAIIKDYQKALE